MFQSTPLREGRLNAEASECTRQVSIHAPARGATATTTLVVPTIMFQSTPLREGRLFSAPSPVGTY